MEPNFGQYYISPDGDVTNTTTGQILKPWIGQDNGYKMVSLCDNGIVKKYTIHRLVATLYVPNLLPDITVIVDHKDGNKLNNNYKNLEWVTYLENSLRALEIGLLQVGEECAWAMLTDKQVHKICQLMEDGESNVNIIRKMDLPSNRKYQSLITAIRMGKNWKQISSQYNFKKESTLRKYSESDIHLICQYINVPMTTREMANKFGITCDKDWQRFRKMVRNVRLKLCYKNISDKYFEEVQVNPRDYRTTAA